MEKTMELKLIRLVSGEEIICSLVENDDSVTISDGFVLIPGGEGKIAFMPFMPYTTASDDGVTISNDHVMFVTTPVEELAAQIKTQLSGIITPPKQGIIT